MAASKRYVSGKLVFPGEKLCVAEEFIASDGTFESRGIIYSKIIGRVLYDFITRRVSVIPLKRINYTPKPGMVVYAIITATKEDVAFTKIFGLNKNNSFSGTFTGVLHVSQVSNEYVKVITDAVKIGDIIKAKVLTHWIPYQLTTKGAKLGVVYAQCSNCGTPLLKRNDKLKCPKCGNVEPRKISTEYLISSGEEIEKKRSKNNNK